MNNNRKIICLIIPSLEAGGMERVMSLLAINFNQIEGINPIIILYGKNREIFYPIPDGVRVLQPKFQFKNRIRIWHTIKTINYIRKQVLRIKPFAILSFGERWNNLVLISLIGIAIPKFVSDRSQPGKYLGLFHEKLRDFLYPGAAGIIAQTHISKNFALKKTLNKNIIVIPNPITNFSNNNNLIRDNIVLTVGRLIPSKNHGRLIDSFYKIMRTDWKLFIVGQDNNNYDLSKKLQKQIDSLNSGNNIALCGNRYDIEKYYFTSKIFAYMSFSEGYPNTIAEALSAGLPVVAFDCIAGPSDMIIDGYNGFLVPLYEYKMFEDKLSLLMSDEILRERLSRNALNSAKKFDAKIISMKFLQFILS